MKNLKILMFLVTSVIVLCIFQINAYANMIVSGDPGGWVNYNVSVKPLCQDGDHHVEDHATYDSVITITQEGATPVSFNVEMYEHYKKYHVINKKRYFHESASTVIYIDKTPPKMNYILINGINVAGMTNVYNSAVKLTPYGEEVVPPGVNAVSGLYQYHQYYINNGAWVDNPGSVSISANGVYQVGFRVRDVAGNFSAPMYTTVIIDSTVQDVTKISDHLGKSFNPQNSTAYTWKYREPVTITAAGNNAPDSLGFEHRINNGAWISGAAAAIDKDGSYLVEFRGVGKYGNYSAIKGVNVIIDRTGPSITGNVYEDWQSVGSYNIDLTASDDFTALKNVQYFVNGTVVDKGTDGRIKYTVSDEGETLFDVKATDEMGNEGVRNITVRIDRTKPDMELLGNGNKLVPVEGEAFKFNKKVTVNAKAYDELSGVKKVLYRINGGNWIEGASMEINETGNWNVEFQAFDKAGNSINKVLQIKTDMEAPEVTFTGSNGIWSNEKSVTVSITAKDSFSGVDKIEISRDEKEWIQNDKIEISEEGISTVYVRVSDLFGNTALKTVIVQIDRTYPKLIIKDHDDKEIKSGGEPYKYNKKPTVFTLSPSDALSGIEIIRYRINDGDWVEGDRIELGTSGNWKLEAEAIDRATNKTYSGIISVMLDVDAPQIEITGSDEAWKSVEEVLVSAEVSDAFSGVKSVEYSIDGGDWKTGSSVRIESEKETHVLFRATDNFGNESVKEALIRIDRSKPVLSLDNPGKTPVSSEEVKVACIAKDYLSGINNSSFRYSTDGETWLEGNTFLIKEEGTTKVTFKVDDNAGNKAGISGTVTIDRTPPSIVDAYLKESKEDKPPKLAEGSYTDLKSLFLFVNAEDICAGQRAEVSKYMYSVSFSPTKGDKDETEVMAKGDGVQCIPIEHLEKGINYVHVYALDLAGNRSLCKVICIKVDGDYPKKPDIISTTHPYAKIPEDAVMSRDAKFIAGAQGSGVLEVKEYRYSLYKGDKPLVKDQSGTSSSISFQDLEDNEPGEYYNLYVDLVGGNGRKTQEPAQYRFRIDSTPPKLLKITSGTHPVENQWYSKANASFQWNRPVDFTGVKTFYYKIENSKDRAQPSGVDDDYRKDYLITQDLNADFDLFDLCRENQGSVRITVYAEDFAGNVESDAMTASYDMEKPWLEDLDGSSGKLIVAPSGSDGVVMEWGKPRDNVQVSEVSAGIMEYGTESKWVWSIKGSSSSHTFTNLKQDGIYLLAVRITDAAGNIKTYQKAFRVGGGDLPGIKSHFKESVLGYEVEGIDSKAGDSEAWLLIPDEMDLIIDGSKVDKIQLDSELIIEDGQFVSGESKKAFTAHINGLVLEGEGLSLSKKGLVILKGCYKPYGSEKEIAYEDIKLSSPPGVSVVRSSVSKEELSGLRLGGFLFNKASGTSLESNNFVISAGLLDSEQLGCYREVDGGRNTMLPVRNIVVSKEGVIKGGRISGDYFIQTGENTILVKDGCSFVNDGMIVVNEGELAVDGKFGSFKIFNVGVSKAGEVNGLEGFKWAGGTNIKVDSLALKNGRLTLETGSMKVKDAVFISISDVSVKNGMLDGTVENMPEAAWKAGFNALLLKNPWKVSGFKASLDGQRVEVAISIGNITEILDGYHDLEQGKLIISSDTQGNINVGMGGEIKLDGEAGTYFGQFGAAIEKCEFDSDFNIISLHARSLSEINDILSENMELKRGYIDLSYNGADKSVKINVEGFLNTPGMVNLLTLGNGIKIDSLTISKEGKMESLEAFSMGGLYDSNTDLDFEKLGLPLQSIDLSSAEGRLSEINDGFNNYFRNTFVKAVLDAQSQSIHFEVSGEMLLNSILKRGLDGKKISIREIVLDSNGKIASVSSQALLPDKISICGAIELVNGKLSLIPDETGMDFDVLLTGRFKMPDRLKKLQDFYMDAESVIFGKDGKIKELKAGRTIEEPLPFIGKSSLKNAYAGLFLDDSGDMKIEVKGSVILPVNAGDIYSAPLELGIKTFVISKDGNIEELELGAELPGTTPFIGISRLKDARISVSKDNEDNIQAEVSGSLILPGMIDGSGDAELAINRLKVDMDANILEMDIRGVLPEKVPFIGGAVLENCSVGLIKEEDSCVKLDLSGKIKLPQMEIKALSGLELQINSLRVGMNGGIDIVDAVLKLQEDIEFENGIRLKNGTIGIRNEKGEEPEIMLGGRLKLPGSLPGGLSGAELDISRCVFDMGGRIKELDAAMSVGNINLMGITSLENGSLKVVKAPTGGIQAEVGGKIVLPQNAPGVLSSLELSINSFRIGSDGEILSFDASASVAEESKIFGDYVKSRNLNVKAYFNESKELEFSIGGQLLFKGDSISTEECPITINSFVITKDGTIKALDLKAEGINTGVFNLFDLSDGMLSVKAGTSGEKLIDIQGKIRIRDNFPSGLRGKTLVIKNFSISLDGAVRGFEAVLANTSVFGGFSIKDGRVYLDDTGGEACAGIGGKVALGQNYPQGIKGLELDINSLVIKKDGSIKELDIGAGGINATLFNGILLSNGTIRAQKEPDGTVLFNMAGNLALSDAFPQSLRSKTINLKKLTLSATGIKEFEASVDGESSFEFLGGIEVKTNYIGISKTGLALSGSLTFPQSYPEGFAGLTLEVSKLEMGWDGKIKEIYTTASQIQIKLAGFVTDIEGLQFTKDSVKIGSCILTLPDNMGNKKMGIANATITADGKFRGAFITPDIDKDIAGCNLKLKGCSLDIFERRIKFEKAQLTLPGEVGGYSIGLNGVTLDHDGIKFRGGSFRIPSINVGSALNISNAYVDFKIEGKDDFYIEGGAAITIADVGSYQGIISFGNRSAEYPIGLRRAEFTFSIPGLGIPIGNSGLYIKTITGGIAFGEPYEIPGEVRGMFRSGMRIKMGVGFIDGSGGSIIEGNGMMWIDLTNCGIATKSNVTVLSGLARGEMVAAITKQGFYGRVGLEMRFARGNVTIYVFKYNGRTNVSGTSKLEIGVRKGAIYEKKIGWGWFSFTIKIPPCDFWLGSVNSDFGLFTNGKRGVKAYLSLPWGIGEVGVFVSKDDVDVGGVGSYDIYIPEWARYSSRRILLASASDTAYAVMPDRNTLTYNFDVGGSAAQKSADPSGLANNAMPGRLLITIAYPEVEPEITLESPSGKRYGLDSPNIFVSYHDWGMLLAVLDPEEGQWSLEASNVENKNEFDVQVFGLSKIPRIKIESVDVNGSKGVIKGSILNAPTGSKVDIYLSDNGESHNGLPVGTCNVDSSGRYNTEIDLSAFMNGDYYVYAVLLDSDNSPNANSRYEKTIKVSLKSSLLKAVTVFIASDDGKGTIEYMFDDVNGQKSAGFKLYIENLTKNEQFVINLGCVTKGSIPGFDNGDIVNLSVAPYDSDGIEGGKSKVIEITVGANKDIKNLFTVEYTEDIYIGAGKSAYDTVSILNPQTVKTGDAYDYAGFEVLEIPEGLNISCPDVLSLNQTASEMKFEISASSGLMPGLYKLKAILFNKGNRDIKREINLNIHVSYEDIIIKNLDTRYIVPSEGMEIEIHGESFNAQVKAYFGDKELDTEVISPEHMNVKLPDSVPYGMSEIIIKGPNGDEHKVDFEVLEPSYRLMLSKNEAFIMKGKSDTVQVSFKTYNGYTKDIVLSLNNIPEAWRVYFDKDMLKPGETGVMHVEVPENAVPGEYYIGIIADRGDETALRVQVTEEEHKPYITKLSINRGIAGDKFRIYGGCFKANGKVYIGDRELSITNYNESVIEVQIPEGTNTGNTAFELDGIKYYGPKFNILTDIRLMVAAGEPDGDNGYYRTMPQAELYTMLQDIKTISFSLNNSDYKEYTGRFDIPQGINTLKAHIKDSDGKEISNGSWIIKYDETAPVTRIIYTEGKICRPGDVIKIDGKDEISEINRIMYRYKDGGRDFGPWYSCDGNIRINSGGLVTVEYYGVDNAGNSESIKSVKLYFIESWKESREYKAEELVFWNGKVYRCLISHRSWRDGQPNKFPDKWAVDMIKTPGKANEWEPQVKWSVGDLVTYLGKTYKCIREHVALKDWYPESRMDLFVKLIEKKQGEPTPWDFGGEWKEGETASYNGKNYICIKTHLPFKDWYPDKRIDLWNRYIIKTPGVPVDWDKGVTWKKDDMVTYRGKIYICISEHFSYDGWEPDKMGHLWKLKN